MNLIVADSEGLSLNACTVSVQADALYIYPPDFSLFDVRRMVRRIRLEEIILQI